MKKETAVEYPLLDIVKFLSALWFIMIHCNIAYLSDNELFRYMVFLVRDIGLAAFFASHGFFTMDHIRRMERDRQPETFRKKWLDYAKVYLIWSLIYLPVSVYGEFVVYQESLVRGTGKLIWDFFVTGVHYYTWMLWYFPAMLWSLLLLYVLIRIPARRAEKMQRGRAWGLSPHAIVLFGAALYGIGIVVQQSSQTAWGQIYYKLFYGTQNAAFFGFLFIAWGMYSAGRRAEASTCSEADKTECAADVDVRSATVGPAADRVGCQVWLFVGIAGSVVLCLILHDTVLGEILRPVCCILVFELLVSVKWTAGSLLGSLRRMSRDLFLVHMLFVILFLLILRRDCIQPDLISTVGALGCSLAAAGLLEWRRARKGDNS